MSDCRGFLIERLRLDHADGLFKLLNDPVVAHWLGGSREMAAIHQLIDADQSLWPRFGYGMLAAVVGPKTTWNRERLHLA